LKSWEQRKKRRKKKKTSSLSPRSPFLSPTNPPQELTGCGAQCSYAPAAAYPSTCFPRMVYKGVRTSTTTCTDPSTGPAPLSWDAAACGPWATPTVAPGWTLVPPTAIDATEAPCSAQWLDVRFCFFFLWDRNEDFGLEGKQKLTPSLSRPR